jgi:hypothetical protein
MISKVLYFGYNGLGDFSEESVKQLEDNIEAYQQCLHSSHYPPHLTMNDANGNFNFTTLLEEVENPDLPGGLTGNLIYSLKYKYGLDGVEKLDFIHNDQFMTLTDMDQENRKQIEKLCRKMKENVVLKLLRVMTDSDSSSLRQIQFYHLFYPLYHSLSMTNNGYQPTDDQYYDMLSSLPIKLEIGSGSG